MYCSSCGQALSDRAVICTKCGCGTVNFNPAQAATSDRAEGPVVASYIVGAIVPVIGWIMAIYWLVKGRPTHAMGVGALSLTMFFFYLALMSR